MGQVAGISSAVLLSGGLLLGAASPAHAAAVEKELEGIKRRIEKEKQGITQAHKQEGSILQALERIDNELGKKRRELRNLDAELSNILAQMQKTAAEVETVKASLAKREKLLEKRARALYRWHRGGSPFVVLDGGSSLVALMRRKRYLEMTLAFDRALVDSMSEESARYETLQKELALRRERVDQQRRILVEVRESVRKEAKKKREWLASVRREKEARVRAVKELEQAAHRLQKMMDEIGRRSAGKFPEPAPGGGLGALRGKLDVPVRGEIIGGFGKARHPEFSDEVFRKGIDIEAPLGEEIRAVEKGKVVFADRFSGYGKMLIVDHGERYYTVYAHLSDILKKAGDSVRRGERIGLVGDSDSLAGAKLYFEIRKDGRPIDPLPWFRKR